MLFQKAVKVGELLRDKHTRQMWLVVHKTSQGVFIVNLMVKQNNPAAVQMILPGYVEYWDRDTDIDDLNEWEADAIEKQMPLIEEVERNAIEEALENV